MPTPDDLESFYTLASAAITARDFAAALENIAQMQLILMTRPDVTRDNSSLTWRETIEQMRKTIAQLISIRQGIQRQQYCYSDPYPCGQSPPDDCSSGDYE